MLALRDLQTEFGRALLSEGDASAALLAAFKDDPFAQERVAIYRNNVLASLTAVLRDTFPVVCRLVDERFFAYAAHEFVRAHPPLRPALSEYGAAFPDFIERFPPCRELVYLADVARLEWFLNVAATATDENAWPLEALAGIAPEAAGELRFRLNALYLESPWPVDRIWRANQPGAADETIDLDAGGAHLEVFRRDGTVAFRSLDPAVFAFRRAVAEGAMLGDALEKALAVENFVLAGALAELFHNGTVVAVVRHSEEKEAP
jgi:hypothetical protein